MRHRPTDRPHVTDLRVTHLPGHRPHDRAGLPERVARLEVVVAGERTDRDAVAVLPNVRQIAEAPDVDQLRRHREPELHLR